MRICLEHILKKMCVTLTHICLHAYTLYILDHTCPDREMWILDPVEQSKTEAEGKQLVCLSSAPFFLPHISP